MRQFEIHMPENTAKWFWDRLKSDGMRDCGSGMVIVEYDDLSRARDGLRLAQSDGDDLAQTYPVRGM